MRTFFLSLCLLLVFIPGTGWGQQNNIMGWNEISLKEYDALIKKATGFFEGDHLSFSMDLVISSFKTHTAATAHDTKRGYFIASGKNYHHYLMGIHTYQNKNYRFAVDSTSKNILVANPADQESEKILLSNYKQFYSYITKVYKMTLKDMYRVKVVFDDKVKMAYMEMDFDQTGLIRKSTSYFRAKFKTAGQTASEATSPRLETVFKNYKANIKTDYQKEFDESVFFSFTDGKFVVNKKYSGYKIKDTRLKNK